MNFKIIVQLFVLIAILSSCVSNKKIVYLQELEDSNPNVYSSDRYGYNEEKYRLQNFDIVEINIKTSSEELNDIFSIVTGDQNNMNMNMGQSGGDLFFMNGYTLDEEGKVEIPLLGEVNLVGLTTEEAKSLIEEKVQKFVPDDDFFVRVRLGGIRFSALGEFNAPGKQTILQNRVTIFEALAAAGDLTTIAKRDEIILLRQYPDGSQIHKINLNDRELLGSEFYFLKPNDVIYAEPLKVRELGAGTNFIQTLALITSTVSTIALILTIVR
ncbi:polysaccharide biosynthesis/export family protein [Algoriphagus pacificus]|uniref:Polysaccharide biosynthesis/export family protein n=1 Tax=Algoriphagus pacificus TaxID=2811234 RepID=A0ABS3CLD6_9BACT|nr:polysaccharide biosynthesis/export family protein [Algoriphagus pacificus]MBN7817575.1 polysaccharide biosynthesis/export family protein [Algoriphagus pacificus]